MAQHLRALSALAEDLGLIPSTLIDTQPPITPVPEILTPSSDFHRHHTHANTQIQNKILKKLAVYLTYIGHTLYIFFILFELGSLYCLG